MSKLNQLRGIACLLLFATIACSGISRLLPADTPAAVPTFGPGRFDLNAWTSLEKLTSYRAMLHLTFDGEEGGQPSSWSETMEFLAGGEEPIHMLTTIFDGPAPAAAYIDPWSAEMNGLYYYQGTDGVCGTSLLETQTEANVPGKIWHPASFLPAVIGAEEAGTGIVNGIAAKHYTFNEQALGVADRAQASGEAWVSDVDGYLIKYVLTLTGGSDYFGDGGEGTLTWDYQLTDMNTPITIKLPEGCPSGLVDVPLLPDASNILNTGGMLAYDTSSSLADTDAFYHEQIPGLGWTPQEDPSITDTTALQTYTKDDQIMMVIITSGETGTQVRVMVSEKIEGVFP